MADMMANVHERARERDIVPPGYFLLPFLRCPWCFLFLFALHKVTAISGASDIDTQLFKGRQRRRLLEDRNVSAELDNTQMQSYTWTPFRRCQHWWSGFTYSMSQYEIHTAAQEHVAAQEYANIIIQRAGLQWKFNMRKEHFYSIKKLFGSTCCWLLWQHNDAIGSSPFVT